jgi:hypothetical protein
MQAAAKATSDTLVESKLEQQRKELEAKFDLQMKQMKKEDDSKIQQLTSEKATQQEKDQKQATDLQNSINVLQKQMDQEEAALIAAKKDNVVMEAQQFHISLDKQKIET